MAAIWNVIGRFLNCEKGDQGSGNDHPVVPKTRIQGNCLPDRSSVQRDTVRQGDRRHVQQGIEQNDQ